jgi:hypothetical protein
MSCGCKHPLASLTQLYGFYVTTYRDPTFTSRLNVGDDVTLNQTQLIIISCLIYIQGDIKRTLPQGY